MQESIAHFQHLFDTWGYLLLFVYSLGSGYVGIVVAAILSSMGQMDIKLSMLIAGTGNFVGSVGLALLGRTQKKELYNYFAKHRRKFALVHVWLQKYGLWLIFFNKYIYGVKSILPLAIGFSKYDLKKFALLNVGACALWAIIVGGVTFYASAWVRRIADHLSNYAYLMPAIILVVIFGLVWMLKKGTHKS
ncbi:DedA family protein [Helicobacter baculiformis]|uniref:DedA family protein n=1 Tax=Helicobacter baculiformis TaxID=427351 RepID=A0ABV7ZHQ5_9HELI|nr:DedA family protein [Helicobacter baculiformis]